MLFFTLDFIYCADFFFSLPIDSLSDEFDLYISDEDQFGDAFEENHGPESEEILRDDPFFPAYNERFVGSFNKITQKKGEIGIKTSDSCFDYQLSESSILNHEWDRLMSKSLQFWEHEQEYEAKDSFSDLEMNNFSTLSFNNSSIGTENISNFIIGNQIDKLDEKTERKSIFDSKTIPKFDALDLIKRYVTEEAHKRGRKHPYLVVCLAKPSYLSNLGKTSAARNKRKVLEFCNEFQNEFERVCRHFERNGDFF